MVPTAENFDIAIIGGGPGGYAAALYGAAAGLSVALVERDKVGGTCLHRGCIPAKELLETAAVRRTVVGAKEFGVLADQPALDFGVTMARKQKVVDGLFKGLSSLLKGRKVTIFEGAGTLGPDHTVTVAGSDGGAATLTGTNIVLASGSAPRHLPGFEIDGKVVLTSDEVFSLTELPRSVVIIGAGVVGCEFASTFADLGSQVTVLEALPDALVGADPDVVKPVLRSFKKRGIDVRTSVKVTGHTPHDGGTTVTFGDDGAIDAEAVIVCVGRRPLSDTLGLEGTGVEVTERGFVKVDDHCHTTADGVWAVGDLVETPGLAHVGFAEAILVVKQIIGEPAVPVDYRNVPWCIYSHPEVAFVGYTEAAAREAGYEVVVSKHGWLGNSRAQIIGDTEGMVKIIAEDKGDGTGGRVLGVHLSGPWVTEQLGQGYLAVNWEATVDEVAHFQQPHPSLSEDFGETMLTLTGRGLHG